MTIASPPRVRAALLVAGVALLIGGAYVTRSLAATGWDPTLFTAFGAEAGPTSEYAEERLGAVFLRPVQGHDGKFFFVQANDPLLLDPDTNASVLDRPLYRSQRMLYPLLAGGFGLFTPAVIVWAMIAVNVAALGAGTFATSIVARQLGGSEWWGLSFALNIGLVNEIAIGGGGLLGAALVMASVAAFGAGKVVGSIAYLAAAVLAREALLVCAAGAAIFLLRRGRLGLAVGYAAVPVGAAVLWGLYLRWRLGWDAGIDQIQEIGPPFVGFITAFGRWIGEPMDMVVGVVIFTLLIVFIRRALVSDHILGWATVGFVPLAFLFTVQVWLNYFDISRAVALVVTAWVLLAFVRAPDRDRVVDVQRVRASGE